MNRHGKSTWFANNKAIYLGDSPVSYQIAKIYVRVLFRYKIAVIFQPNSH